MMGKVNLFVFFFKKISFVFSELDMKTRDRGGLTFGKALSLEE